jgi:choline dehydrogenase-like flavoprotein
MLIDARAVAPGTEFACDLCIVGAGPAGIAIADRLRASGLAIVLLESGGFHPELSTQKLFRGENRGKRYFRLDACRFRLFGGSSNRWGGWCRPLDAVDYEQRDWLPWSGWPISSTALEPYHADTAKLFELSSSHFDLASWRDRLPSPFGLQDTNFESIFFQYSPETNFGENYRDRIITAPNVTTLMHANLTQMELDDTNGRVDKLRIATLTGRRCSVRPRAVVLATGGIENARLLLASRNDRASGLGNETDMVGRFFMEHLHVPAGHMVAAPGVAGRKFYRKAAYNGVIVRGVIKPTAEAQERHQLLSTSIAIEPASYAFGTPFMGWPPPITFGPIWLYRNLRDGPLRPAILALKRGAEKMWGMPRRMGTWNATRTARARANAKIGFGRMYSLYFRSEQAPDPASRITLSDRLDALGVPEIRLDWRVNPFDFDSITSWLDIFDRDLRARGLGYAIPPAEGWQQGAIGGPHHMGTTRMSADPRHGVVDEDCRVHSVENLYVAGSSVFATGGYANPTFTLVALALRLADKLRDRLGDKYEVRSNS